MYGSQRHLEDLQESNKDLLAAIAKLKNNLAIAKTIGVMRGTKRKLQTTIETIYKLKSKTQTPTDLITSLSTDYNQLLESKANDKSNYNSTLS